MFGRIVGFIACIMCAFPFFVISTYNKDSKDPITFWSGDNTLKSKVKNVQRYNNEMALLYKKCAIAFLITGIGFLVVPFIGVLMLCFDCTLGIYLVYRCYKKILNLYSQIKVCDFMSNLYVSDLDGTLLRSNETTSEYTNYVINSLVDKGMIFSYATARSLITAKKSDQRNKG